MANERDTRRTEPPKSGGNTTTIVGVVVAVILVLVLAYWFWPTADEPMVGEPTSESIQQGTGTDPEGTAGVEGEPAIGADETVIEQGGSTGIDPIATEPPDSGTLDTTPGEAPPGADNVPNEPVAQEDAPVVEEQ